MWTLTVSKGTTIKLSRTSHGLPFIIAYTSNGSSYGHIYELNGKPITDVHDPNQCSLLVPDHQGRRFIRWFYVRPEVKLSHFRLVEIE